MAALEEDDNFDEESFPETALLSFAPDIQGVLDDVICFFNYKAGCR